MECLSQAWSIVPRLWECCSKHSAYTATLEDSLNSLRTAMDALNNLAQGVKNRVEQAEEQLMKRTDQVIGWLMRVDALEEEVNRILQKGDQELENKCLGSCCPKNCRSRYKLGKKVMKMVPQVTGLVEEGQFDFVARRLPPPPVDEQPMDNVEVGFESILQEVWRYVQNDDCPVIGLVGMGGVGKTTLMKQLNNQFLNATHTYDLVIWIVVSKPANLGKIRGALQSKLNIPEHMWENISEDKKNSLIFSKLKHKKFVVLLDDMWEALELSEVGIPRPNLDSPGSKIVFTTRSREVCRSMDAYKVIQVGCLPPDQAFRLFSSKLGQGILESFPEILGLITDVVNKCEGLPLALITIGRALSGRPDTRQWKEAKRVLKKYPFTFPGMGSRVFPILRFSYDNLSNPVVKKCFEYCSLCLNNHNILEEEVIKLWLAEGFIGEYDNMHDALIQGRQVMESLKQECLLETGERSFVYSRYEDTVKMHGLIRDMALWIDCERGEKKNRFYVEVASDDIEDITVAPNAEKISLRGTGITTESLMGLSHCPDLTTLIIQHTRVEELPDDIVHSMNILKVLDLSHNDDLRRLPIGCLTSLEYLNVAGTRVRLPMEASQWKKLRFLIVDDRMIIPREIISSLCSLQMFEQLIVPMEEIRVESERKSMEREMLRELEGLEHIMDIRLALHSATGIKILLHL